MTAKICFNCDSVPVEEVCVDDLSSTVREAIKEIIKKEGFTTYTLIRSKFGTGGGNFLGELFEIDIKGDTSDGAKETSLFIKQKITFGKIKALPLRDVYLKESFIYTELSKIFNNLQEQANVPINERFRIAKAYDGSNEDVLILENLAKQGFKTYGRLDVPPLRYFELAIQQLAKFHALSFVIQQKLPDFHDAKIKTLDHLFRFDDDWAGLMRNIFKYTANLFENNLKIKIENFLPILLDKLPKYNRDKTSVRCCLSHSDYKINNILVREINDVPVEVVPVDFQLLDYGCPLRDLLFFTFSSSDRDFRKKHLNSLKELYFNNLSAYLKYFDVDVDVVYPRKEFENAYKGWMDFGLMHTLYASIFQFAPETGIDVENLSLSEFPMELVAGYKERVRGWIEDFIEWGYL